MRIGSRTLLLPWLFSFRRTRSVGTKDYFIILQVGRWALRILYPLRMGGTTRTTSFYAQFYKKVYSKEVWHEFEYQFVWELDFCWRPDVTHYWAIREPRLKRQRAQVRSGVERE